MGKRTISWKWLAIIAGVTAVAVAGTLGVCLLQPKEAACAPGFSYGQFESLMGDCIVSPFGDVFQLQDEGLDGSSITSANGQTMVCSGEAGLLTVFSRHGAVVLEQPLPNWGLSAIAYISFQGNTIYFFAEEQSDRQAMTLWCYDVESNTSTQIASFPDILLNGVVSPYGSYFAVMDGTNTVHIYNRYGEVQTWPVTAETTLYFLTDDGALFFGDGTLQSLYEGKQYSYTTEQDNFQNVMINKDGTELLVNLGAGESILCQAQQGIPQQGIYLDTAGNLAVMQETMLDGVVVFTPERTMLCEVTNDCVVYGVDSFRDLNLVDESTGERVKLTEDYKAVYQENSGNMQSMLATSGKYIMYIDANGDYFYTDTEDVEGNYKLLWEASKADEPELVYMTGQKSFYYMDAAGNLHYTKLGKDKVLLEAERWMLVGPAFDFEDATDTLYFMEDGILYCCREGGSVRRIADSTQLFPQATEVFLSSVTETPNGVYCYGYDEAGEFLCCRLYADGSYQMIE